ncbi:MAG: hypothetical protein ACHQK9_14840, partial [Reyranellales bacterium]
MISSGSRGGRTGPGGAEGPGGLHVVLKLRYKRRLPRRGRPKEQTMIKFYYNLAPNPTKVALCLEEMGLPYE